MIRNELINQSIDYILKHLDEEISIEDVAGHCNYSKYHFSRMFKEETGESIYAFIKRLKMEQSAINIKVEKDKTITDIGLDYGYSSSNYSSAFKKHLNVSPAEFRKSSDTKCVPHPFYRDKSARFETFEEYDRQIRIEVLPDFTVIHERYIGNYLELGQNWSKFTEKYKEFITEDTLLLERFYDDPSITGLDQCLYDLCMTVDKNCTYDRISIIRGGRFAIFRFDGPVDEIFPAFQGVFSAWLPYSEYEMDERYGLDIYRMVDRENNRVVMDLCIPVR